MMKSCEIRNIVSYIACRRGVVLKQIYPSDFTLELKCLETSWPTPLDRMTFTSSSNQNKVTTGYVEKNERIITSLSVHPG